MARQMKDSGIPYLGPVPASWDVQKLRYSVKWKSEKGYPDAEVLALYRDYGVIPKSSRDDNHNVTSLDTSTYKYVEIGDFVINKMKAWQGSMGVSSYSGIISPAYHVCSITNDDIHRPYFHYLLRNVAYLPEFARLSTGLRIGQWDLSFDDFRNLPFLLPDKSEQERIANLLDTKCAEIDKVVEQTRATIEEYKKLKQAIITEAVTKGVRGHRPMKPSGVEWIGDIPEEWNIIRLRYLCNIRTGNQDTQDSLDEGKYPFYVRSPHVERSNKYTFEGEDILMAGDGAGAGKIFHLTQGKYACHQRVYSLHNIHAINRLFLFLYLQTFFYISIETANSKSTVDSVRLPMLLDFPVTIPNTLEQQEIATYLDTKCAEIDRIIEKKEQLIKELGSYKKSLIYEYVTGKKEFTV